MMHLLQLMGSAAYSLMVVYTLTFVLLRLPTVNALDARISHSELNAEAAARLRASYGLDQPIVLQYLNGAAGLLTGSWGRSMVTQQPVSLMIGHRVRNTLLLACLVAAITMMGAVILVWACLRSRVVLQAVDAASAVALGLPVYWTGTIVLLLAGAFIATGQNSILLASAVLVFHMALPLIRMAAHTLRLNATQPHVQYAHSRGLTPWRIFTRHVAQPSAPQLLPYFSTQIVFLISSTVAVEAVFGWPGVGSALVSAVTARDYPVVQAIIVLLTGVSIVSRAGGDALVALLDPRARMEE